MSGPTADVSVRPAVPGDERALARVQVAAWRGTHTEVLGPDVLDRLDETAMTEQWAAAVTAPPAGGYRVLVACDGPRVVGLVSLGLVPDEPGPEGPPGRGAPGGVLLALEVDPGHRRAGHGSRLLAAAVDTLRTDGADQVHTWVLDGDEGRRAFLRGAGLGPQGVRRTLATGTGPDGAPRTVREERWAATI
nr:GNAT family N-acetyltransferase [Cellulomonas endophytica]